MSRGRFKGAGSKTVRVAHLKRVLAAYVSVDTFGLCFEAYLIQRRRAHWYWRMYYWARNRTRILGIRWRRWISKIHSKTTES